jgi:hypothetical protein
LRKGRGQGGGLARAGTAFSPNESKDKRLYEDLRRISELNSFMRVTASPPTKLQEAAARSISPK